MDGTPVYCVSTARLLPNTTKHTSSVFGVSRPDTPTWSAGTRLRTRGGRRQKKLRGQIGTADRRHDCSTATGIRTISVSLNACGSLSSLNFNTIGGQGEKHQGRRINTAVGTRTISVAGTHTTGVVETDTTTDQQDCWNLHHNKLDSAPSHRRRHNRQAHVELSHWLGRSDPIVNVSWMVTNKF